MSFCRFFKLDRSGHIVGLTERVCADAEEVLSAASHLLEFDDGRIDGVEVWDGTRRILRLRREKVA